MKERRSHPRLEVSHPVLYFSDTYPKSRISESVDISLGGTRMETNPHSLTFGEDLDLSIAIHPRVITCRGKVVHILQLTGERLQAGVRFEGLSKQDRLYLGQYISHKLTNSLTSPKDLL